MSKSTNTKQEEKLATQENVENNLNKKSTLAEQEKIEGTPFTLIKHTYEDGSSIWYMVIGDYRVTEPTETKEEQIEKLESEKWLLIMHICIVAIKKIQQIDKPITGIYKEKTPGEWKSPREIHKETGQKYNPKGNITDKNHDPLMDE